jgi:hypothetical protein
VHAAHPTRRGIARPARWAGLVAVEGLDYGPTMRPSTTGATGSLATM